MTTDTTSARRAPLRIFTARVIHTMDASLPRATAVGVIDGRIVAVGDLASMAPWREGREVVVDDRLRDKVLMPGFIDNHIHPFLGSLLLPMEIIAPEPWRMPDGEVLPQARTPDAYLARLRERLAARDDHDAFFISWGYQPALHGRLGRPELDRLCPDRPVVLWQRSYHETYVNSRALDKMGLTEAMVGEHPQVDWARGHFFETGNKIITGKLMPLMLQPNWYHRGLERLAGLMQQGGITTAGDMLFGGVNPEFERAALAEVIEKPRRPLRVVNVCDARGFSNRASGRSFGPPDAPIEFERGLEVIDQQPVHASRRVRYARAVKLFADGAMFSQLMQMRPPGYIDGHHGEWLMAPAVLEAGVLAFWRAGYQIHVHVNGDAGMDAVLQALAQAQRLHPRFDHRFIVHHVGFHASDQTTRLAALGAHASLNTYYLHALSDDYARLGLGPERASQIARAGTMVRAGLRVSFHSDFMMAPAEPLLLAWCAASRRTHEGNVVSPTERLTLEQALRGITIDAAYALGMDEEIGSIVAGKLADFTVLEDDPFDKGAEGLKDVRVAGTVFEGEVHLLARPVASLHGRTIGEPVGQPVVGAADTWPAKRAVRRAGGSGARPRAAGQLRYRPVRAACCGPLDDRCDVIRQLSGWAAEVLSTIPCPPAAPAVCADAGANPPGRPMSPEHPAVRPGALSTPLAPNQEPRP